MSNASAITVRMPHDLKQRLESLATQQGVSLNQMAMYALTNQIALMESNLVVQRLQGKNREEVIAKGLAVLDKVQSRPVPEWDRLLDDDPIEAAATQ